MDIRAKELSRRETSIAVPGSIYPAKVFQLMPQLLGRPAENGARLCNNSGSISDWLQAGAVSASWLRFQQGVDGWALLTLGCEEAVTAD